MSEKQVVKQPIGAGLALIGALLLVTLVAGIAFLALEVGKDRSESLILKEDGRRAIALAKAEQRRQKTKQESARSQLRLEDERRILAATEPQRAAERVRREQAQTVLAWVVVIALALGVLGYYAGRLKNGIKDLLHAIFGRRIEQWGDTMIIMGAPWHVLTGRDGVTATNSLLPGHAWALESKDGKPMAVSPEAAASVLAAITALSEIKRTEAVMEGKVEIAKATKEPQATPDPDFNTIEGSVRR